MGHSPFMVLAQTGILIHSTLSKTNPLGSTGSNCPFWKGVHLIRELNNSKINEKRQGEDQHPVPVLKRCPSYRGVH